jgi:hypothetical protein
MFDTFAAAERTGGSGAGEQGKNDGTVGHDFDSGMLPNQMVRTSGKIRLRRFLFFLAISSPISRMCHAEAIFTPAHRSASMIFSLIINKIRPTVS